MSRTRKPRILISACLLGDNVRYDGRTRHQPQLHDFFALHAELIKVCPEVGAGFSVPRPPVQLILTDTTLEARGVDDKNLNATEALLHFARQVCQQTPPDAVIVKSRSPSCGFGSTPIFDSAGNELKKGNGLFSETVKQLWPETFIIEDEALQSKERCHALLQRLEQALSTNGY